jgi:F-box protein 25/32
MPFLGQDWRSPGDQWVRTGEGWQRLGLWRLKLVENINENVLYRLLKLADVDVDYFDVVFDKDFVRHAQTFVHIKEVTKEQKMRTTLAEALSRLDVSGAVRDHRRFNYVCDLVMYIIEKKYSSLSGSAQKTIIDILEQIVRQAVNTHGHLRTVQKLVSEMHQVLEDCQYDHVGSQQLWDSHGTTVNRLQNMLNDITLPQRAVDGKLTIAELPDDVLRNILSQLADHQDLVNAGQTGLRTFVLSEDYTLWRSLATFHFTDTQQRSVLRQHETLDDVDWKTLYCRLVKRYGLRSVYAEMLHLCRHCNSLFWQHHGHPCPVSNVQRSSCCVSPQMFLSLFSA